MPVWKSHTVPLPHWVCQKGVTKSSPHSGELTPLLMGGLSGLGACLPTTAQCGWDDSDCGIFEIFSIKGIRTGKGLMSAPVCKQPSWPAASQMLRNASVLQVRAQAPWLEQCQQFQFQHLQSHGRDAEMARWHSHFRR